MKKYFLITGIIILFILLWSNISLAATGDVEIKSSTDKAKAGDSFVVTISVESENGINCLETTIKYDENKLELVSSNLVDSEKWLSMGSGMNILVLCNTEETIKQADILQIILKVKENVNEGEKLVVETEEITLDTDEAQNSNVDIQAKSIEIEVEKMEEEPTDEPKDEPKEEPKEEPKDEPSTNLDNPGKLPQTGKNILIYISIIGAISVLLIAYKKYIKYIDIK